MSIWFNVQVEFYAHHGEQGEGFVAVDAVQYRIQQEECVFEPEAARPLSTTAVPATTIATEPPDGKHSA